MKRIAVLVSLLSLLAMWLVGALLAEPRSGQWPRVRMEHLREHPYCEACGTQQDVEVHHVRPFHLSPESELDPANLITLCRTHHFEIGHDPDGKGPRKSNWSAENRNVWNDATRIRRELWFRDE